MSEERIIRINKVLRELNISLERAVDYLKDKGIAIEANPNTKISDDVYNVLCGQFAGDKGNKEASKEVGEEKRKEKEALRIEREKELEEKRRQEEERQRQQEVIKARAVVTGPKQVGTIDLNPKKPAPAPVAAPVSAPVKAEMKEVKPVDEMPAQKEALKEKEAPAEIESFEKKELKPIVVLLDPVVFADKERYPIAVLLDPVVFADKERYPIAVLLDSVLSCNE